MAARLGPEIMLVDEVSAVGAAAFRKKRLGKMGDVAREGRTVLFVSHNMAAINNVCERAMLLIDGQLAQSAESSAVITSYLTRGAPNHDCWYVESDQLRGNGTVQITG